MGDVVGTLDPAGWVTGANEKADALLAQWSTNQRSQSILAPTSVESLISVIQRYSQTASKLADEARRSLTNLFEGHFDSVEVSVTVVKMVTDEGRYDIRIQARLVDGTVGQDLARMLYMVRDRLDRIEPVSLQ